MTPLGIALREMARRRRGLLVPLAVVACVLAILTVVWTLRDATVQSVASEIGDCPSGASPDECNAGGTTGLTKFTRRELDTPLAVQAGDQINVTVVISFS